MIEHNTKISSRVFGHSGHPWKRLLYLFLSILALPVYLLAQEPRRVPSSREIARAENEWLRLSHECYAAWEAGSYGEAQHLAEKAMALAREYFGDRHRNTLTSMGYLAQLSADQGRYTEALALFEEVVPLSRELWGVEHTRTLSYWNGLAGIYHSQGDYAKARSHNEEILKVRQRVLGRRHPKTLVSTNNLAMDLRELGDLRGAQSLWEEALRIGRDASSEQWFIATLADNLAELYQAQGEYAKAEPLIIEAFQIRMKELGEEHPSTLVSMNNLAEMYRTRGDLSRAHELHMEALTSSRKVLGETHPDTLTSMVNLASLYDELRRYSEAESLYQEIILLQREVYGETHPDTLKSMNGLAAVYYSQEAYAKAQPLFEDVLSSRIQRFGERHPDTLASMSNLATAHQAAGNYAQARRLHEETLQARQEILGEHHPDVLVSMLGLAVSLSSEGRHDDAGPLLRKVLRENNRLLDRFWSSSESTRLSYLDRERGFRNLYLSFFHERNDAEALLEFSLTRKGLLGPSKAEIQLLASSDPEVRKSALQLQEAKQRYAELTWAGPKGQDPAEYREELLKWEVGIEILEKRLAGKTDTFGSSETDVAPEDIVQTLTSGEVLIDFHVFTKFDIKTAKNLGERLVAIVATSTRDSKVQMIDLGPMAPILQQIEIYRTYLQGSRRRSAAPSVDPAEIRGARPGGAASKTTAAELYRLIWEPLAAATSGKQTVYVVPDGPLHLLPFVALIDGEGRYLAEAVPVVFLFSVRDLVLRNPAVTLKKTTGSRSIGEPALFFAPNYDLGLEETAPRSAVVPGSDPGISSLFFEPLPGTEREGHEISKLMGRSHYSPQIFRGEQASETNLESVRSPRILHIATHGFFLDGPGSSASGRGQLGKLRDVFGGMRQEGSDTPYPARLQNDSLLRSGLALAGANSGLRSSNSSNTRDGLFTAREAQSLTLASTELVVLSACETGVGELRQGEGVYGLRLAFHEAGAKAVLSTLWAVDDEGTRAFMKEFYSLFLAGVRPRAALRRTQLKFLQDDRWRDPFFWASFTLVGID